MAQLQDLTRCLLSAGGAVHPEGKGIYFLYTTNSTLISKHWTGTSFGDQEVITTSVRPDSQASYLLSEDTRIIVCISSSSVLRRFNFDNDEEEWVEDDAIPQHRVHVEGKLAASFGTDEKARVFFQDPSERLVCLNESFTPTVLPAKPVLGSPITTTILNDALHVFYVSSSDKCIHYLTQDKGGVGWSDKTLAAVPFEEKVKQFMVGTNESGGLDAYVLTEKKKVFQLTTGDGKGEKTELGRADETGKFVPGTSAECCRYVWVPVVCYRRVRVHRQCCCW